MCYPWATTLAPSGGTCNGHLQTKGISQPGSKKECILPFRGHVYQPFFNNLKGVQGSIKNKDIYGLIEYYNALFKVKRSDYYGLIILFLRTILFV